MGWLFKSKTIISIQALYDYKDIDFAVVSEPSASFQFKHCTIISLDIPIKNPTNLISIQALYDYKSV